MIKPQDVVACIVYYKGTNEIIKKANSLAKDLCKVLIVINEASSTDAKIIKQLEKTNNIVVISNQRNMGIAYALNQAIDYCCKNQFDYLITLDQDTLIDIDCIAKLAEFINVEKGIVSVGPYHTKKQNISKQVNLLITSGNLLHVTTIKALGGFNDELFVDGVDADISYKIIEANKKVYLVGDAYMQHQIGNQKKSRILGIKYYDHSPIRYYYMTRNTFYICQRYGSIIKRLRINSIYSFIFRLIKILFIECDKKNKLIFTIKGIKDGVKNQYGGV